MFCCAQSLLTPLYWQEIVFATIFILCYLGTGIGSAVLASQWGNVPEGCPDPDSLVGDLCDTIPLTATNALEAVSEY